MSNHHVYAENKTNTENHKRQACSGVKIAVWAALCIVLSLAVLAAREKRNDNSSRAVSGTGGQADSAAYQVLDTSHFTNPSTKNSTDLVLWSQMAYDEGWGYVYGTFGYPLGESMLADKVRQYPKDVGQNETFIREHWLGRRTVDCMGLIKSYMWYDPVSNSISYRTGEMPDWGCDTLFAEAEEKGTIDTIPETAGLAVYAKGHIGVYIGDGYVIDAQSTTEGVTKTKISTRKWTHWFKIPYVVYAN